MNVVEYDSMDELWIDAADYLWRYGDDVPSRDGDAKDVEGFVARLTNPANNFMFNPKRRMSPSYAGAEVLWYLSGENHIEMLREYAAQYERFTDEGVAFGSYGARWSQNAEFRDEMFKLVHHGKLDYPQGLFFSETGMAFPISQLQAICWLLHKKPETRQAIMTCWSSSDLPHAIAGDKADLPCTVSLKFRVKNGKLNVIADMRSNDIWLGLPYDAFAFTCIQQIVAEALGLELGWYQHQAASLHVYERNYEKFKEGLEAPSFKTGLFEHRNLFGKFSEKIPDALKLEEYIRGSGVIPNAMGNGLGEYSILSNLLRLCAVKWCPDKAAKGFEKDNPLMAKYIEKEWS